MSYRSDRSDFTDAQKRRALRRSPICEMCNERKSTEVDHRVADADGGDASDDNAQALCGRCHREKSTAEAARGRRRQAERQRTMLRRPVRQHPGLKGGG